MPNDTRPIHMKNGENYSGYNFLCPQDTKDCDVTFTSSDDDTTTDKTSDGMTSVSTIASGEAHSSLFGKISKMFLNIRKLWNTVGETDISSVGSTVTGAINNLGWKTLWTNISPSSDFAAQSILLSSSDYDFLVIFWLRTKSTQPAFTYSSMSIKGSHFILETVQRAGSDEGYNPYIYNRAISYVSDTELSASAGQVQLTKGGQGSAQSNAVCVPYVIYGFKA